MIDVIPDVPIQQISIPNNTITKVLSKRQRNFLGIFNESGTQIFVGYSNTAPVDSTTMHSMKIDEVFTWAEIVPQSDVYILQTSGAPVNVKVVEAR